MSIWRTLMLNNIIKRCSRVSTKGWKKGRER